MSMDNQLAGRNRAAVESGSPDKKKGRTNWIIPLLMALGFILAWNGYASGKGYRIKKVASGMQWGKCSRCGYVGPGTFGGCLKCGAIITNPYRVSYQVTITTKNQDKIAEIARMAELTEVRAAAIEQLADQSLLIQFAKTDPDVIVRVVAAGKIVDTVVLEEIARTDPVNSVRIAAIANPSFTNQQALADIALAYGDFPCRLEAIARLTDISTLERIARIPDQYYELLVKAAQKRLQEIGKQ